MPEVCVGDFFNKNKNILQQVGTEIYVYSVEHVITFFETPPQTEFVRDLKPTD
jgi:hypothetical protein